MIRRFTNSEILETFIETVHEESPISLVEGTTRVKLSSTLHSIIQNTITKLIGKASPDLSISVRVDSIREHPYRGVETFEPLFTSDPADVPFYITREADPVFFESKGGEILTTTDISVDYYYPSLWTMTPPRNEEAAIRRTMDEIMFAWIIASKTLMSVPIIRFDDEDEAAEAVFAFANTLLFTGAVSDPYYYEKDFIRRLMYIQKAIKGGQPALDKLLATILYPPNKKIGQLEVPVANILHNRITQYAEGYLSCHGEEKHVNYYKVLEAFKPYELQGEGFAEKDMTDYLLNHIGRMPPDFIAYDMHVMQHVITNDDYGRAHPPMITTNFKGIYFNDICPFTYGSRALTSIYFEKDFVSHLEKTFKHLDVRYAVDIARRMGLPKGDEINDGYDVDPSLINLGLFHFDSREGNATMIEGKTKATYKNYGLYKAEERAATVEPSDADSIKSTELLTSIRIMPEDAENVQERIRDILWPNVEDIPF